MTKPAGDEYFHEVWWIYSPAPEFGVRLAHFRKTVDGVSVVMITGEDPTRRIRLRIWDDVVSAERWVKVKQVAMPTRAEIDAVMKRVN